MKSIVCVLAVCLYIWTWGTFFASIQGEFPHTACERYRSRLAMAAFFALLPPMWVMSPFMTGFYRYGWRLKPPEGCPK